MVDSDKANDSLSKTDKKAEGLGQKFVNGAKVAGTFGIALAGAATVAAGGLFALVNKTAEAADFIDKLSERTGINREELQRWKYAAEQSGADIGKLEVGVKKLSDVMDDASNGNERATEAFSKLGISMDDLKNKSQEEIFENVMNSLADMEEGAERNALGNDLLGKSYTEMLPLLNAGSEGMDALKQRADELGIVMSEESVKANVVFGDTLADVKGALGAVGMNLANEVLPIFQGFLDWILAHMPQIREFVANAFDKVSEVMNFVTTVILPPLYDGLSTLIGWIGSLIERVKTWVADNTGQLGSLKEMFLGFFETVKGYFDTFVAFVTELWAQYGDQIVSTISTALSTVVAFVQEKLAVVLKFWQDNGAQIMAAVQNAFNLILATIEFIMPLVISVIQIAWQVISTVFSSALDIIMGLFKVFAGIFTGDFSKLGEGLKQIWSGLWSALGSIISGAWSLLSAPFRFLWDKISGWFSGLKDDAVRWGVNMIMGFADGIISAIGKAKEAAGRVMTGVSKLIGFNSPSEEGEGRHIVEWGANMIDGFLEGAEKMLPDAKALMNNVVGEMKPNPSNDPGNFNAQKGNVVIPFNVDGYEIARAVIPIIDILQQQEIDTNLYMKGMKT